MQLDGGLHMRNQKALQVIQTHAPFGFLKLPWISTELMNPPPPLPNCPPNPHRAAPTTHFTLSMQNLRNRWTGKEGPTTRENLGFTDGDKSQGWRCKGGEAVSLIRRNKLHRGINFLCRFPSLHLVLSLAASVLSLPLPSSFSQQIEHHADCSQRGGGGGGTAKFKNIRWHFLFFT